MDRKITLTISDEALASLGVSYSDFLEFVAPGQLPHETHVLKFRPPMEVVCLVDMDDGTYRLGGEFIADYISRRTGTPAKRASDLRIPRRIGPGMNLDVDPWNGGENNIN